jgi:hypothetical protein
MTNQELASTLKTAAAQELNPALKMLLLMAAERLAEVSQVAA